MLKRIWANIIKAQEIRAAEYVMQNMTDKQLKDMGITRGEIKQAVRS
jgi:uncharacterized protein YjiS (DUF1127 family)